MILHEIFRVVLRFPRYAMFHVILPLGQCSAYKMRIKHICFRNNKKQMRSKMENKMAFQSYNLLQPSIDKKK